MLLDGAQMLTVAKFYSLCVAAALHANRVHFQEDGSFYVQSITPCCTPEYCRTPAILLEGLCEYFAYIRGANP